MTEPSPHAPFRRALVIHNPTAGGRKRRRLDAVLTGLEKGGCHPTLYATTRRGDAEDAARDAAARGFDVVVVAGGDGTVNEAANGLAGTGTKVPLALIPLGTANVLAAELGLSLDADTVTRTILAGKCRPVRLGRAGGRHFVLMASCGVDAAVVHGVSLAMKRHAGRLAYGWEALRQGLAYGFPEITVTIDNAAYRARMAVACKSRCYGGPFTVAPQADLGDEWLHVVLLKKGGLAAVLRYGAAMALGRLDTLADVQVVRGARVTLGGDVPIQADGDALGTAPLELSVSPHTIQLVAP